jgi:hypothetical protein
MTRPKPPLVLIEAWVLRVRQLTKARKMLDVSRDLFDRKWIDRSERYKKLGVQLERAADSAFLLTLAGEWKTRVAVEKMAGGWTWVVTTWPPYRVDLSEKYTFTKSLKMPTKNPRTFENILKNGLH